MEHDAELGCSFDQPARKGISVCRDTRIQGIQGFDMSFADGFALEDHIFKALALGAPYTKLVCMGRAIMIPGFVGSNIEGALHPERKGDANGHWSELPKTVKQLLKPEYPTFQT